MVIYTAFVNINKQVLDSANSKKQPVVVCSFCKQLMVIYTASMNSDKQVLGYDEWVPGFCEQVQ